MDNDDRTFSVFSLENLSIPDVINHAYLEGLLQIEANFFVGIGLFYGSWNKVKDGALKSFLTQVMHSALKKQGYRDCGLMVFNIPVDSSDASVARWIGETNTFTFMPAELPALAVMFSSKSRKNDDMVEFLRVANIDPCDIIRYCKVEETNIDASRFAVDILRPILTKLNEIEISHSLTFDEWHYSRDALRIFVAGDRSSVGKSSVCLGILGSLLNMGYSPESLAYIKPATQSESTQLIQLFCEQQGIHCVPVGPLVYYRGFTRAFLAGETEATDQLLRRCSEAVDRVARGKRVVLVDGVGFPAVGSICGTSNAAVAYACGYPTESGTRLPMGVVLVGGSGVGAAVDAFNLNATYFEQAGVPVMGGIFNKLSETGFYSLENCKTQISAYFKQDRDQITKGREPFGFVPIFPRITGNFALDHVKDYIQMFRVHVDVDAILEAAKRIKTSTKDTSEVTSSDEHVQKQRKLSLTGREPISVRSRKEIEAHAISSGAAPSA